MRWLPSLALVLLSACTFMPGVPPIEGGTEEPLPDFAGHDLTGVDLAHGPSDLARADLATPPDQATAPDHGVAPDLAVGSAPPVPSHLPGHFLGDGTCALTAASSIDTGKLTVDGAKAPGGCVFTVEKEAGSLEVAVLAVKSFTVADSTTVRVYGSRPLVIVAGQGIAIAGTLDGSASSTTPGPGGASAPGGAGMGGDGGHAGAFLEAGGGGAGYGGAGARGGDVKGTVFTAKGGGGGGAYPGDVLLSSTVPGGSAGGRAASDNANGCKMEKGGAGAGGGSIQLSAGQSITIDGSVLAGGGGGLGGCYKMGVGAAGGGGGGSGGAIYLEAPSVTLGMSGTLAANGGGGGGGAEYGKKGGGNGEDGSDDTSQAPGGSSPTAKGGAGGSASGGPGEGASVSTSDGSEKGGGGGGAVGRIIVRSHGAPALSGTVSPPPTAITSL